VSKLKTSRYAIVVCLVCLLAACTLKCFADMTDPIILFLPVSPATLEGCGEVWIAVEAGDVDICCAQVVDDRIVFSATGGWMAQGDRYFIPAVGWWGQWFKRSFATPGTYTATFTADDEGICGVYDVDTSGQFTVIVKEKWFKEPDISVQITAPAADAEVATGSEVTCTATATDMDSRSCTDPGADECTYTWYADGGTTFKDGVNTGQTVTWIAPPGACTRRITVWADDLANLPSSDCGDRNDDPKSAFVYVDVVTPVLLPLEPTYPPLPPLPPPPPDPVPAPPTPPERPGPPGGDPPSVLIMTGGVQNAVHQALITATTDPPAPGNAHFAVVGGNGVNIHAGLSLASTGDRFPSLTVPLSGGQASVYLTSSDKDPHEYAVTCTFGSQSKTVNVSQATGDKWAFVCDPACVPADGESTTTIWFCLIQAGTTTPVPGHAIVFEIDSVLDADGNAVSGPPYTGYGSIIENGVTGADGYATGTYKVGTEPGTIYIKAVDNNDQVP